MPGGAKGQDGWNGRDAFLMPLFWFQLTAKVLRAREPSRAPCQICTELKSSREKQQLEMSFRNEAALYFS